MPKDNNLVDIKLWDIVLHYRSQYAPLLVLIIGFSLLNRPIGLVFDRNYKLTRDTIILKNNSSISKVCFWNEIPYGVLMERNAEYNRRNYDLPEYC